MQYPGIVYGNSLLAVISIIAAVIKISKIADKELPYE